MGSAVVAAATAGFRALGVSSHSKKTPKKAPVQFYTDSLQALAHRDLRPSKVLASCNECCPCVSLVSANPHAPC